MKKNDFFREIRNENRICMAERWETMTDDEWKDFMKTHHPDQYEQMV